MTWETIYYIGQTLGVLVIIATLIALTLQIRRVRPVTHKALLEIEFFLGSADARADGGADIQNGAEAAIRGAEIEGSALLADGLSLTTNFSFLDTEITQGMIPAIGSSTAPFPIGAPLPLIPETSAETS